MEEQLLEGDEDKWPTRGACCPQSALPTTLTPLPALRPRPTLPWHSAPHRPPSHVPGR